MSGALGPSANAVVITLRSLDVAERFPVSMPRSSETAPGPAPTCRTDGAALEPAVITTFGPAGDPAVWAVRPVALDGWRCPTCQAVRYPRALAPAEITRLTESGLAAARAGKLDEAEYWLRRVACAWPGFSHGRINLASVYLDRLGSAADADVPRLVAEVIDNLEQALTGDPPPPPVVRVMLGRVLVRSGNADRGRAVLTEALADPATPPSMRSEARALLEEAGP
ncbi:MAG: hypothetical protein ABMB14_17345 [Myxococcota bacterium]